MQTNLVINRGGFPPFSARGCQQTLQPLNTGELRRTVNGELLYTGRKGHHKYASIIECQDEASLALEGIWRGEPLHVQCIQRLWQEVIIGEDRDTLSVELERKPVQDSVVVLHNGGMELPVLVTGERVLEIQHAFRLEDRIYINYRPHLHMRVTDFTLVTNEWHQRCGWRLQLEEI